MTALLSPTIKSLDDEEKRQFVLRVEALEDMNFPMIAKAMGLNWFTEVKPALESDKEFKEAFMNALGMIKFSLLSSVLAVGRHGKQSSGSPELSYVKFIIDLIDKGGILEAAKEEVKEVPLDAEALQRHLERINQAPVVPPPSPMDSQ